MGILGSGGGIPRRRRRSDFGVPSHTPTSRWQPTRTRAATCVAGFQAWIAGDRPSWQHSMPRLQERPPHQFLACSAFSALLSPRWHASTCCQASSWSCSPAVPRRPAARAWAAAPCCPGTAGRAGGSPSREFRCRNRRGTLGQLPLPVLPAPCQRVRRLLHIDPPSATPLAARSPNNFETCIQTPQEYVQAFYAQSPRCAACPAACRRFCRQLGPRDCVVPGRAGEARWQWRRLCPAPGQA